MGTAALINLAFTIVEAGLERTAVVNKVAEMESAGASADQISDALIAMRKAAEAEAQAAIDKLPG